MRGAAARCSDMKHVAAKLRVDMKREKAAIFLEQLQGIMLWAGVGNMGRRCVAFGESIPAGARSNMGAAKGSKECVSDMQHTA